MQEQAEQVSAVLVLCEVGLSLLNDDIDELVDELDRLPELPLRPDVERALELPPRLRRHRAGHAERLNVVERDAERIQLRGADGVHLLAERDLTNRIEREREHRRLKVDLLPGACDGVEVVDHARAVLRDWIKQKEREHQSAPLEWIGSSIGQVQMAPWMLFTMMSLMFLDTDRSDTCTVSASHG
jgi:hypothetical protein